MAPVLEQPSPLTRLASSHASGGVTMPSPITGVTAVVVVVDVVVAGGPQPGGTQAPTPKPSPSTTTRPNEPLSVIPLPLAQSEGRPRRALLLNFGAWRQHVALSLRSSISGPLGGRS